MCDVIEMPTKPATSNLKCATCGGPIGNGEAVVIYNSQEEGTIISHRFKSTCQWHQENIIPPDSPGG